MLTVVRRVLGKDHTDIEDVAPQAAFAFLGSLARFRCIPDEGLSRPWGTAAGARWHGNWLAIYRAIGEVVTVDFIFRSHRGGDRHATMASASPNTIWSRLRLGKKTLRKKLQGDRQLTEMLGVSDVGNHEVVSE